MRQLQPVLWTKGTLLSPQYLQMQDRYLEDLLDFRLQALSFRPSGFSELRLDHGALSAGMISVDSAAGIFPDGLLFEIGAADRAPDSRPIGFPEGVHAMDIFLAVPSLQHNGVNVAVSGAPADARFVARDRTMRDENRLAGRTATEKPVLLAGKNFRFLFEHENRQGFSSLPLARVLRNQQEAPSFDEKFLPPLLDFRVSGALVAILRRLVEKLSAKSSELAGMRREQNLNLADFTSSGIANFWLLYTVNSHFPLARHLLETKGGHPEELFGLMRGLAGALTTFSRDIRPQELPLYNHEDLRTCFEELDEKLHILLDSAVPRNFLSLALKPVKPYIYGVSLTRDGLFHNTKMYLAMRADMEDGELIELAPKLVKVVSGDQIDQSVGYGVDSVLLTHAARPPSALPVKKTFRYFSLDQTGEVWKRIVRARNLAAYVPGQFINPEIELVILLPEAV